MSRRLWLPSTSTRSTAPTIPPASPIAPVRWPSDALRVVDLDADGEAVLRARCGAHWAGLLGCGRQGMLGGISRLLRRSARLQAPLGDPRMRPRRV